MKLCDLTPDFIERMELRLKANALVGPDVVDPESSRYWIYRYAEQELDVTYDWLMSQADATQESGAYGLSVLHPDDSTLFEGDGLDPAFWLHYKAVRGSVKNTNLYLSCSC